MTTGTKTFGISSPGHNASGSYTAFDGFVRKTWSGQDYPPGRPRPPLLPEPKVRTIRAWENGKMVETTYPILYDAFTNRKPRRAYTEEHPYTMSYVEKHDPVESLYRGNPYQGFVPVYPLSQNGQGFNSGSNSTYGWTASHDYRLFGKLREKVAGSSFNAGVFLGEGRQALTMIANAATSLAWGYRAAKQGDFRSAARYLVRNNDRKKAVAREGVATNWLQLQYGWLPLLADVHDGAQFLAHHLNTPLQHVIKVRVSSTGPTSGAAFQGNGYSRALNPVSYRETSIKAILKEVNVYQLSGLTDPLSVAWELVPYSFVVDWFLPVGDYLSCRGLASAMSGTFVTSTKTCRGFSGITGAPNAYGSSQYIPPVVKLRTKEVNFSRTVSNSISVPKPQVVPLSEALSWKRAANAVALLSQLVR